MEKVGKQFLSVKLCPSCGKKIKVKKIKKRGIEVFGGCAPIHDSV